MPNDSQKLNFLLLNIKPFDYRIFDEKTKS